MTEKEKTEGMLSPYRALDLTDQKGLLCGKILGDLGADVIKIEPPAGDPSRNIGPFYGDVADSQKSLYWYAFNTSKRGITLDLESPQGRETFKELVSIANVVIESFAPGHMDKIGLGYTELSRINPGIIMTSITPFGQTGPYKDLKASDIVIMGMGGQMHTSGDPDRPPVRISVPQASLNAGAHAAVGTLIALHHQQKTGQGQQVDVSMEEAIVYTIPQELWYWEYDRVPFRRHGAKRHVLGLVIREIWPCKDGHISFRVMGGGFGRTIAPLVEWMNEEGMAGILKEIDWDAFDMGSLTPERYEALEEAFANFFATHTKAEISGQAVRRRFAVLPVYTPKECLEDEQLESRNFWHKVEHAELGATLTYPGAPYTLSRAPWQIWRRAPLIGEHNTEVLVELKEKQQEAGEVSALPAKSESKKVLEGVIVVDFSMHLAGPLTTKYLADFGAKVIKVEASGHLDVSRVNNPFKDGIRGVNRSVAFPFFNSSKLSFCLDLDHPQALEIIKKLIARSDVVVENFAPGTMARRGLAYQDVIKIKPDIIMLSTSNQGQTGPRTAVAGFGWNLNGLAGFNHFTGWPDREPVSPNVAYTDFITPLYAVSAILAALDCRRRTGQGLFIDISQYEAGLTFLATAFLDLAANGREQGREGNRCPQAAPHGAYPCRGDDSWCTIAVFSQEEWHNFCQAIGNLPWTKDPRFATLKARKENEDQLDSLLAEWTAERSAEEVMAAMQAAGVAAGVVQNEGIILEKDPQLMHRGYFQRLNHPEMGPTLHPACPVKLSRTPVQLQSAPCLGEHNELVCTKILEMSDSEFLELMTTGAFG